VKEISFQTGDKCWFWDNEKWIEGRIGQVFPKEVDGHPQEYDVFAKGWHIYLDGMHLSDDKNKPIGLYRNE